MKRTYKLEELDCANCALKIENAIQKIEGVNFASVNFLTQKLTVDIDDGIFDGVFNTVVKICKKIEPDMDIVL